LLFNNSANITVSNVPQQTIGQLYVTNDTQLSLQADAWNSVFIQGGPGPDFVIDTGSRLNLNGTNVLTLSLGSQATGSIDGQIYFSIAGHKLTANSSGSVVFNAGSQFVAENGFSGNPFGTTASGSVVFAANSTYIHQSGSNPFSSANVAVFQTGSLYKLIADITPSFSGRTYANLEIDAPLSTLIATGSNAVSIDNLTITAGHFQFNVTGNPGHAIKGDISVAPGASLSFLPLSAANIQLNGTAIQSIGGEGSIQTNSLTTFSLNNAAGISLSSDLPIEGTLSLINGLVRLNNNILTLGLNAQITGSFSPTNMIAADGNGELRKKLASVGSYHFAIGDVQDGADYSPATINLTAATVASGSWIGLKVNNNGNYAQGATYLNRYWEVTSWGLTNIEYSAVLGYPTSDVVGLENELFGVQITTTDTTYFDYANTSLHQLEILGSPSFGIVTAWQQQTSKILQLSLFLEGLYEGGGLMRKAQDQNGDHFSGQIADLLQVELRNSFAPYAIALPAQNADLLVNGLANITIPAAINGNYYIVVKHRNSIETWSAMPYSFANSTVSCNFSSSDVNAYGSNLKFVIDAWVLYGGDVTQDGAVSLVDVEQVTQSANFFGSGFLVEDVTGDGITDAQDIILIDNNAAIAVVKIVP
jgi:hypothetical protein